MQTSSEQAPHLVIGTAGHIDHGKTSLVKALTGRDLDKLEEEKRRGITIELGFAFYGDRAAFVDVPGHERLVKNMIAGAAAMRAALLVVAGDDGVMPQTREHLAVLDALGVSRGVVAVTKADLVDDPDWLDLVSEEVRELLEPTSLAGSPVIVVDSLSGQGIEELRAALDSMIDEIEAQQDPGFFRLPVDRSFVIKGHGRVVTGTVWSGTAKSGDKLTLLPGGEMVRVRGLQAHESAVESVQMGDRAALNLATDGEPERGQVLVTPGRCVETDFLDARLSLLPGARDVTHRMRVRVHLATGEAIARVLVVGGEMIQAGTNGLVRIALENPVPAMHGDRGVLRLYSPMETLGGIRVLDPLPPDRKRSITNLVERLTKLGNTPGEQLQALIEARGQVEIDHLLALLPWPLDPFYEVLDALIEGQAVRKIVQQKTWLVDSDVWNRWKTGSGPVLAEFHTQHPEEAGMPKASWAERVIGKEAPGDLVEALATELAKAESLKIAGGFLASTGHEVRLQKRDEPDANRVHQLLVDAGINVPLPAVIAEETGLAEDRVRSLLRALKQVGRAVILEEKIVLATETMEQIRTTLKREFGTRDEGFVLKDVTTLLDTTRKYGVPLLEQLDREGFTQRDGDKRTILD
ncbi:selenocysteine-specific translation elongation factor [bacterium]|nr:selenocysteine-specific translation elongation factor [bacterium]